MDNIAIDLVEKYILNHLDKSDAIPSISVYTIILLLHMELT